MQIGAVAEAAGLTTKTIRFYEDAGLLPPPPRTSGGYRDYPTDTLVRLRFIRDARSAGLTLAEIAAILEVRDDGRPPCAEVSALIEEHLHQIEHRLRDLRATRAALRRLARRAAEVAPDNCLHTDICTILTPPPDPPSTPVPAIPAHRAGPPPPGSVG